MGRISRVAPLLAAILVGGCERRGSDGDAGGDVGPYADKVRETIPQIERSTGLKFKTPPKLEVRTKAQVREFLLSKFDEQQPAQELAAEEHVYKTLGLIPQSLDLRKFLLDLYMEQIVGFYDPAKKVLYVVEGAPREIARITVAHELIHALQDQYLNLDSLQRATGNADRTLAAQAVVEGQATYEQMINMVGGEGNIAARLPGGWDQVRQMIREARNEMPIFATAPILIQEALIFPYLSGAEFVRRFKEQRPGESPLQHLPVSTEQVLQTSAFFGPRPDLPTRVTLPAPRIGQRVYENNLGELGIRIFVYEHGKDQNTALRAAAGWDGDRYVLVRTPAGHGIAWVTVWDTAVDAAEFAGALAESVLQRYGGTPVGPSGGARSFTGSGRSVQIAPADRGGKTIVMYTDVPAGQSLDVLDLAKVGLSE
ncbi:MAG: hypothetical protein M3282_12940 [Gemmatimonadota bacterium]|nr:hypothetical protein [Gemmatimonadota bacterium]